MDGVLRSHQVTIDKIHYSLGLFWSQVPSRLAIAAKCRLLKLSCGVYYPKEQLLGLVDNASQGLMPLASVVAKRFENGVFISDNLIAPVDGGSRLIWVCAFKNGLPISQLSFQGVDDEQVAINSDSLIVAEKAQNLLRDLDGHAKQTIYADIQYETHLVPSRASMLKMVNLFQEIDDQRLKVPRIKKVYNPRKYIGPLVALAIIVVLLSILSHFFFNHQKETPVKNQAKTWLIRKDDFLIGLHKTIYNANGVNALMTLKQALHYLPMSAAGWHLVNFSYDSVVPGRLNATYAIGVLGTGNSAKAYFEYFPFSKNLRVSRVNFYGNLTRVNVQFDLQQVQRPVAISALNVDNPGHYDMNWLINFAQQYNVLYQVDGRDDMPYGYSKLLLSFKNINTLGLDTVLFLMSQTPMFTVSTIVGNVSGQGQSKGINWSIEGGLYEKN